MYLRRRKDKGETMNEQQLQAIEERRKGADMITIEDAVTTYPMHKMADAYFAEWVGDDVNALIAEVRLLRAKLDAVPVDAIKAIIGSVQRDNWTRKPLGVVERWLAKQVPA